jgi:hypothetical protein
LNNTLDTKTAAEAFNAILEKLGRDDLTDILLNWDDCEISEDGKNIIQYLGRDREYSHGKQGGKTRVSKTDFLNWLLSDDPFDEKIYGANIRSDTDWTQKIEGARQASGLISLK